MALFTEDNILDFMKHSGFTREKAERFFKETLPEMGFSYEQFKELANKVSKSLDGYTLYDDDQDEDDDDDDDDIIVDDDDYEDVVDDDDKNDYTPYLPAEHVRKYIIRVSLKCPSITIWRKFECPSNISLRHFADLIIDLMDWTNSHLNHIKVGKDTYYVPRYQHEPDMEVGDTRFQEDYTIADILQAKGKKVCLRYDFGDSWDHEILLSSIDEYEEDEDRSIRFIGGKGACPPEDCGGISGYEELLDLYKKLMAGKRLTREEKESLKWADIDKNFDPEYFDEFTCIDWCDYYSEAKEDEDDLWDEDEDEDEDENEDETPLVIKTTPLCEEVLKTAFNIADLAPWFSLADSDVFAVRMQDGSDVYIVVMGNGGGLRDIHIYDGAKSFQIYFDLLKGARMPQHEVLNDDIWAEYYSLTFGERGDGVTSNAEYSFLKQWSESHGIEIGEDIYPILRHQRPHLFEQMMYTEEGELVRIKEVLDAVNWLSDQLNVTFDIYKFGFDSTHSYPSEKGGKVVPLVVKTADGYKIETTTLPGLINDYPTVVLKDSELSPLRSLPKKGAINCKLMHCPRPTGNPGSVVNTFFPLFVMCVQDKSGFCSTSELCEFSDQFEHDTLISFTKKFLKDGTLPERIKVDDPRTEAFMQDFCKQLGITLERKRKRIPLLAEACKDFFEKMMLPF